MFAEKQASSVCVCVCFATATLPDTRRRRRELQGHSKSEAVPVISRMPVCSGACLPSPVWISGFGWQRHTPDRVCMVATFDFNSLAVGSRT